MQLSKNIQISTFLRERRKEVKKTIRRVAEEVGWSSPQSYGRCESYGFLPKNYQMQQKLADALHISLEELTDKCLPKGDDEGSSENLLPLLNEIAKTNCQHLTFGDLEYLAGVQAGLRQPLSAELIQGLMQRRHDTEDVP